MHDFIDTLTGFVFGWKVLLCLIFFFEALGRK